MNGLVKPAGSDSLLAESVLQVDLPLGALAGEALISEVLLSPKPGLVDQWDRGSHKDLSVLLMVRSAKALVPFFNTMADEGRRAGVASPGLVRDLMGREPLEVPSTLITLRERIGEIGREAEARMMRVTQNVNTHRGAIWTLGLLSTAAALDPQAARSPAGLCKVAGLLARLPDRYCRPGLSNGLRAVSRYQVKGAREQAQMGFPAIVYTALPALVASRQRGESQVQARLNTLVALMAILSDTCVLSRAGRAGLALMQRSAKLIIQSGGVATDHGYLQLVDLKRGMIAINASPGGAADLLAATLFIDAVVNRAATLAGR